MLSKVNNSWRHRGYKQVSDRTGQWQKQKEYLGRKTQSASTLYPQKQIHISEKFPQVLPLPLMCPTKELPNIASKSHIILSVPPAPTLEPKTQKIFPSNESVNYQYTFTGMRYKGIIQWRYTAGAWVKRNRLCNASSDHKSVHNCSEMPHKVKTM